MNKLPVLTLLAVLTVSATALAGNEAFLTADLSAADQTTYYVHCQYQTAAGCSAASVWEETNGMPGLQTKPLTDGTPADHRIVR